MPSTRETILSALQALLQTLGAPDRDGEASAGEAAVDHLFGEAVNQDHANQGRPPAGLQTPGHGAGRGEDWRGQDHEERCQ